MKYLNIKSLWIKGSSPGGSGKEKQLLGLQPTFELYSLNQRFTVRVVYLEKILIERARQE